tara:strand:- start:94 stop:558 length:465 start_codon:yes stop_codon:yes gene_type:complete
MAFSSINTDLDINFNKNKFTDDIAMVKNTHSIKQSLINLILTIPGEKPFNRNFGTPINDLLFENFDPMVAMQMQFKLRDKISLFEPRIKIEDIIINDAPITESVSLVQGHNIYDAKSYAEDNNFLFIYISYFLTKFGNQNALRDTISIGITKVR